MTAIDITQHLVNIESVTPHGEVCLDYIEKFLTSLNFTCYRLKFEEPGTAPVDNLYAEYGVSGPNLCFAGHVDIVPAGDAALWSGNPFESTFMDGMLVGRGAVDMKGAIGAYLAALKCIMDQPPTAHRLSLMITCDEEGVAINGTAKIVAWLKQNNKTIDLCIVGEPTSVNSLCDTIKIGRRGSLTAYLTVEGTQGHVAYPQNADNPIPRLMTTLQALDRGLNRAPYQHFDESNFEVTTVDTDNPSTNVIPQQCKATMNIRFNPTYTADGLKQWITSVCDQYAGKHSINFSISSDAFYQHDNDLIAPIQEIIHTTTGYLPKLSTSGGTSDARFIHKICPVIELGLVGQTMHQIDERVALQDLTNLQKIYGDIIKWWSKR